MRHNKRNELSESWRNANALSAAKLYNAVPKVLNSWGVETVEWGVSREWTFNVVTISTPQASVCFTRKTLFELLAYSLCPQTRFISLNLASLAEETSLLCVYSIPRSTILLHPHSEVVLELTRKRDVISLRQLQTTTLNYYFI